MSNYTELSLDELKNWFNHFAENECQGNAELYYTLCKEIANDYDLLKIASFASVGQPMPNIFLGAVHYLLLKNRAHELAKFYPTISKEITISKIPFELFRSFCCANEVDINKIISTKIVQTNVVNRCAYLFPIISYLASKNENPITIIDIGTSAGLTLNFDNYEYWLDNRKVFGSDVVKIHSEIHEGKITELKPIVNKLTKIGIDQNLIEPTNEDEKLWLKALVWADHIVRFENMDSALKNEKLKEIQFIKGSTIKDFNKILGKINKEETLIIYATHTLYQFSAEDKVLFYEMLDNLGKERDLYFISAETTKSQQEKYNSKNTIVELISYTKGSKKEEFIAETNGHGNWVAWKQIYID
jgi:hypothetical protein